MSGRESSWQPMASVENLHRSARVPPATHGHAGHIRINYDTAGHTPTSRLCRVLEEHRESIRVFLAMIDPNTGYIGVE